jgi:hypothetical protein
MKRKLQDAPLIDLSSEFDRKDNQSLPSSVVKKIEELGIPSSQISPTKNAKASVPEKVRFMGVLMC